jgi:activator of HSP90 ATPase
VQLLGWKSAEAHLGLGKTKNGVDVSGSINVPEVAHDTEPEDYVVCS